MKIETESAQPGRFEGCGPESEDAQPRFTVGRDRHGWWIVLDALDHVGGLFATREAALHFAQHEGDRGRNDIRCMPENVILKFHLAARRSPGRIAHRSARRKSA